MIGRVDDALALFGRLIGLVNDVGLLAEEYDPGAGRQLGNFPQAFTHVCLVNTAAHLSRAAREIRRRRKGPVVTSTVTEILIDCTDADLLAAFWCEVLGWRVIDRDEDDIEIGDGTGGLSIVFERVPERKTIKNRIHLDVKANDGNQDAEVERILALGARRVDIGQGDVSWVVLADPEGNEFCVLSGAP